MNRHPFIPILLFIALLLSACAPAAQAGAPKTAACPVTRPPVPAFTPPAPLPADAGEGYVWYGSSLLLTSIPQNGIWESLPHSKAGFTQKVFFWSQDFDINTELQPALTLSGRRLDGDSPSFDESPATNGYTDETGPFMLIGIDIPTEGCWEFTATYRKQSLTFILKIEP